MPKASPSSPGRARISIASKPSSRLVRAALPELRHLAATHLYRGDDLARIERLDRLAKSFGGTILASNDVHYHTPAKRPLQDVLTCIREKTTLKDAGFRLHANAERHLKGPEEMARLFERWPHALPPPATSPTRSISASTNSNTNIRAKASLTI